ncbi:HlyD family secretion protein [Dyella acidiphila]|uniref:HlyD family efflux transporter periplasmic adaptor subunit n=1 Tax=Dyella acidiphila TaxID=2775866 RepID=A0ABR9G9P6_9GAMM|nr:HlyD family efflux transporter periplasmic adaptor subunit [Dyella acidiphila]MBE1160760.1 HlyD family efflux transporter periplasmic adaptor subunit [Dyella acidiphila]
MAAQRGEWMGSMLVATQLSRWLWMLLAVSLAVALMMFLLLGHYTRRESVNGQLVPNAGVLHLSAVSAGLVTRVWVSDGQAVKTGDALIEISGEQESAAIGSTYAFVDQQLRAKRWRLQEDLQAQDELKTQQAQALQSKVALLQAQLVQVAGQLVIQRRQAESARQLLERIKPLGRQGYVSAFQIQQQENAALDASNQYKSLLRQQLDIRQQRDTAEQQLRQLPLEVASRRNDIERQLADIGQSVAHNEVLRGAVIRAPRDGLVSAVLLKQGQAIGAGQSALALLPAGSALQAQLLVPSRAAGFIEPGHRVVLRYAAFPYQKFGQQYGRVLDVSRSALAAADVQALGGRLPQEPLYRVLVALDSQQVMAYGKPETLKAGMAMDADILLERRSLLEWVFEPLYGMVRHGWGGAHG